MKFCILIPVFNEDKTINSLVGEAKAFTRDIIIVDDGSTDETASIVKKLDVVVISHAKNKGKGASLRTGFEYILKNSSCEYIIVIDADGQHSPQFIPDFIRKADESKADIVIGNRMHDVSAMPFVRKLTNRIMSFIISKVTGQNIPDTQCGYRLLRRRVLEELKLETFNYDTESEILFQAAKKSFKIDSVGVSTIYQKQKSSINPFIDTIRFIKLLIKILSLH